MNEPVEITAADGVTLRGEVHRGSPYWAILVHDHGADLESLGPLASALAREEFSVLGIDLRGHGLSDGVWDEEGSVLDLAAAIAWARQEGAGQVFAVAAGESATALFEAAGPGLVAAAVLLGPRASPGCTTERIRRWSGPRLFVVGSNDVEGESSARGIFDVCIGPRLFVQLPTDARVHDLLIGEHASQALSHAVGYLAQNRSDIQNRSGIEHAA
jgi:pimeloyl-ACP methyl ester carboxylesterase